MPAHIEPHQKNDLKEAIDLIIELANTMKKIQFNNSYNRWKFSVSEITDLINRLKEMFGFANPITEKYVNNMYRLISLYVESLFLYLSWVAGDSIYRTHFVEDAIREGEDYEEVLREKLLKANKAMHNVLALGRSEAPTFIWGG